MKASRLLFHISVRLGRKMSVPVNNYPLSVRMVRADVLQSAVDPPWDVEFAVVEDYAKDPGPGVFEALLGALRYICEHLCRNFEVTQSSTLKTQHCSQDTSRGSRRSLTPSII